MSNLYLIGMMGCGKSTVAKIIARGAGKEHFDIDELIEEKAGKSITEIFEENGEESFRNMETEVLEECANRNDCIYACGGGIILKALNIDIMKKTGIVVLLDRKAENILKDIDISARPLLNKNNGNLEEIYNMRRPLYEAAADIIIDNNQSADEAVLRIKAAIPDFFLQRQRL